MVLSPEQIQTLLSNVHIKPPRRIIVFNNKRIRQGIGDYKNRMVLGLHRSGDDAIILTHDSPPRTLMHESIHNMGVYGETATRTLAAFYNFRARWRILPPLLVRRPRYEVRKMPPEEVAEYMKAYGLSNNSAEPDVTELVLMD